MRLVDCGECLVVYRSMHSGKRHGGVYSFHVVFARDLDDAFLGN